jgi:hypothetical protein
MNQMEIIFLIGAIVGIIGASVTYWRTHKR